MTRSLIVTGGGLAGLVAAIAGVEAGLEVTLLDDGGLQRSASAQAQGGFSAVTADGIARGDSVGSHVIDTLEAGARHGDAAIVAAICDQAHAYVDTLTRWGTAWDLDDSGRPALTREAAHSADRILHCGGDATGAGIVRALGAHVRVLASQGRLTVRDDVRVSGLILRDGAVRGVRLGDEVLDADAVLLSSGGISGVYDTRTSQFANPGLGAALAWNAGAVLTDVEMVQFHPTYSPEAGFMLTEALRGEGAVLKDWDGQRFMLFTDPRGELAPRDVVARGVARAGSAWLDAGPIVKREGRGYLARRFPTVTAALAAAGLDLEEKPVIVRPAEHYWMGGVAVDAQTRSTVPGLLAAGETARTGFHGANRLASNSLLEAVHGGLGAVRTVLTGAHREPGVWAGGATVLKLAPAGAPVERVRALADEHLGVHRTEEGMRAALADLQDGPGSSEALIAQLIATAGLARTASLGAHYRDDSVGTACPGEIIALVNARPSDAAAVIDVRESVTA